MGILDGQRDPKTGSSMGSVPPGPRPGYHSPAGNRTQPVTGNGRPPARAAGPGQSGQPQAKPQPSEQALSGGGSGGSMPPPAPAPVGFTIPWHDMHNPNTPQPVAELGKISYNPLTGEWFMG